MPLISINPATSEEIKIYPEYSLEEIDNILSKTINAQKKWSLLELDFRLECISHISGILKDRKREYASIMANEMGKPIAQAKAELDKCAWLCDYYKQYAPEFLSDKFIETEYYKSIVTIQPIGLILGIMPWNFPFWQVFRFAIPVLIAGNGAILKHASNVQGCAFAIESLFIEAGFPSNIFRNISISGKNVKNVIKNKAISAVSITGSTPAGSSVAQTAGKYLKKTVLELGGSDPYIVLDDADLDNSIQACINGRILNSGQSCISAKRLIITKSLYHDFLKKLKMQLSKMIMGDPMDNVDIGPMVSINARDEIHDQVTRSVDSGAILELGGEVPDLEGCFYPVTMLSNVRPGMPAFDEEIFGPVFSLIKAEDEEDAIKLGNNTQFGLGAAIFTENIKRAEEIAKSSLNAGLCFVNDFVKSDPRLPFGGVKESGYGRELSSYGLMEFVNVKTVVVNNG
tara:strand:+ start:1709 stop:3079 length:1371 start_codon:yes stop_codon:yes gene_type:complete